MNTLSLTLALLCGTALAQEILPDRAAGEPVKVSAAVMAMQLESNPAPVYPPIAIAAHVSGTVMMHAIIDAGGAPRSLQCTSGPEMLKMAAIDAVRQWRWKPYLVNGQPVPVDTAVAVNFTYPDQAGPQQPPSPGLPQENAVHIAGGVIAGQLLTRVYPVYPAEARANHISGTVVMHAVIDRNGKIANLNVISGPDELRGAALDAVSQWTYRPYLLNGEPTEVDTTITVNFNFGGPPATALRPASFTPQATQQAPVKVAAAIMAANLVEHPDPICSPEHKGDKLTGSIVRDAIIAPDGRVANLSVVSGPEALRGCVVDAVGQWTYKPYLVNGQAVAVETTITIDFSAPPTAAI